MLSDQHVNPAKPLGHKSYGTIAHLPGSRQDRTDVGINPGHARICLERPRDKHDRIIVLEKLDGSNVSVANIDGVIVPLIRAGYTAVGSNWTQHRLFAAWVFERTELFAFLKPGERLCGEWLALAHGTRYTLKHEPFVAFDIMRDRHARANWTEVAERVTTVPLPKVLHDGGPINVAAALKLLGEYGHHGATDPVEGAVWRVERKGVVDFLAKYVRADKVDGKFLPDVSKQPEIWNWRPPTPSPRSPNEQ